MTNRWKWSLTCVFPGGQLRSRGQAPAGGAGRPEVSAVLNRSGAGGAGYGAVRGAEPLLSQRRGAVCPAKPSRSGAEASWQ